MNRVTRVTLALPSSPANSERVTRVTRPPLGAVTWVTQKAEPPKPIAEALETIAHRLRCLGPDHRDPERFHRDKSDLVAELRRLAQRERVA